MKKNWTKFLALVLVALMIFTGCNNEAENKAPTEMTKDDNVEENDKATEDNTETEDDETISLEEVVTVEFWHGYTPEKVEVLDQLILKYEEENPNVDINAKFVASGEEMLQKVQAVLLTGDEPNLLWGYPTWTGVLESSGKLVELGARIDDELKADLPKGIYEAGMYNGKVYSVPIEAGTLYLIYNKDRFEEKGINQPPTTWDELYETAKLLTEDDKYGVWLPVEPNERTTWTWETFLWQNGGSILNKDGTGIGFDNQVGLEALEMYTKIINDGYAPLTVGQDPFIEEQVAMVYATQGAANAYINKHDMNVGVAMLPGKKQLATGLGSNHYFMFESDEAKEVATLDFIKWMTTGENHADWVIGAGYLPVSNSARESMTYKAFGEENPHMLEAAKALTYGVARPPIELYPQISAAISETIEKIVYGVIDVEEGMKEITERSKDIFEQK